MIPTIKISENPNPALPFHDHPLAHKLLDRLEGVEIGAAAHNPFNLPRCINIASADDFEFYKSEQIEFFGSYADVARFAEAHALPLAADSVDYIISSHVFEHLPDPLAALAEWERVVRDGGYIFIIVPLPGALQADAGRPIDDLESIMKCRFVTVDTWDYTRMPIPGGKRGHYHVYTPDALAKIIQATCDNWKLVAREEVDAKVGNGFMLCYQLTKPVAETAHERAAAPTPVLTLEPPEVALDRLVTALCTPPERLAEIERPLPPVGAPVPVATPAPAKSRRKKAG